MLSFLIINFFHQKWFGWPLGPLLLILFAVGDKFVCCFPFLQSHHTAYAWLSSICSLRKSPATACKLSTLWKISKGGKVERQRQLSWWTGSFLLWLLLLLLLLPQFTIFGYLPESRTYSYIITDRWGGGPGVLPHTHVLAGLWLGASKAWHGELREYSTANEHWLRQRCLF